MVTVDSLMFRMPSRISVESRLLAAFVAGVAALALAACMVLFAARAWLADEARVDVTLQDGSVLSKLSSTIDAMPRDDERARLTKRVRDVLAEVRADRTAARQRLEARPARPFASH